MFGDRCEIFEVESLEQNSRGKYTVLLFLKVHKFSYNRVSDRSNEAPMLKTSSIRSSVSTELRLVTDRHRATSSTADA